MAKVEVERISKELYRIHGILPNEGSITATPQDMLMLMDWCQRNIRELEEEARKMNRRAERRNRK